MILSYQQTSATKDLHVYLIKIGQGKEPLEGLCSAFLEWALENIFSEYINFPKAEWFSKKVTLNMSFPKCIFSWSIPLLQYY